MLKPGAISHHIISLSEVIRSIGYNRHSAVLIVKCRVGSIDAQVSLGLVMLHRFRQKKKVTPTPRAGQRAEPDG